MDFAKRDQQRNCVDEHTYKAYAEAIQRSQHQLETVSDFPHATITMEQLHQVMQNTLNASSLVHNLEVQLSPRKMSTLMLKTNHQLGRHVNYNEFPSQNLSSDYDMQQSLLRNIQDEVVFNHNLNRSVNHEGLQQSGVITPNIHQEMINQDVRNSILLIQNMGRNLVDALPQNMERNSQMMTQSDVQMNRNLEHEMALSHHLARSQNIEVNHLSLGHNDQRHAPSLTHCMPSIPEHRSSMVNAPHTPFQIKSEDNDGFYDSEPEFARSQSRGHVPMEQPPHAANQIYSYYNQPGANSSVPPDLQLSRQEIIQHILAGSTARDTNPQNLVVQRQDLVADSMKRQKMMGQTDAKCDVGKDDHDRVKSIANTKALHPQFSEGVEQENDSSLHNKTPALSTDDVVYKSLIEAEYANIKGEYICYKCSEVFSSKRTLKHHSKICSLSGERSAEVNEKPNKFCCTQCPYKCQSPAILKIHERTHTGEKPFSCKFCDYKSGQKNNVAKHILVHMKEKPFRCQFCDYRCAQKNNLVVHERTHTGYKPFECTFCDYRTVQKPNLVKHMYLHTDQKPFSCDICSYRCVQKTNLMKHKMRHSAEHSGEKGDGQGGLNKSYKARQKTVCCMYCPYKCIQKSSLSKHMKFKHADVDMPVPEEVSLDEQHYDSTQVLNLMKNLNQSEMRDS